MPANSTNSLWVPSVVVDFCPLGELGSMETTGADIVALPFASDV